MTHAGRLSLRVFSPQSKEEFKSALDECIRIYAKGNLIYRIRGVHGKIGAWDLSSVTDMKNIFRGATAFNADISKWDVSSVTDMSGVFNYATSFNRDISKWDVSSVTAIAGMFYKAEAFNGDISKWDVSSVQ